MKKGVFLLAILILLSGLMIVKPLAFNQDLQADSNLESLGEWIFFNPGLTLNGTQLCTSYLKAEAG